MVIVGIKFVLESVVTDVSQSAVHLMFVCKSSCSMIATSAVLSILNVIK